MSTATVEAIFLEGIDLEDSPPCQLYRFVQELFGMCGKRSVARVVIRCSGCGSHPRRFVCQECLDQLKSRKAKCGMATVGGRACLTPITDWKVI